MNKLLTFIGLGILLSAGVPAQREMQVYTYNISYNGHDAMVRSIEKEYRYGWTLKQAIQTCSGSKYSCDVTLIFER